ncbi:hypothetical protein IW492_17425 [Enterococcus sp. BWB1-3]|uniref:Imm50 family immunity protein n=1 Tax=Enterococcus sp. BWB1-3 TaxID=2787713 RepID=UPI00192484B6|nr:Imm50 family immunity protein [Enterococcus sp. BWB1-3]MBL1231008.1 hypothetical protein [Enterococcus sp. BWB1-3]
MWYDLISKTEFLDKLYNNIPMINNVDIYEIRLHDCGDRILISFRLDDIVDNVPAKWKIKEYDIPVINLELFGIRSFSMETHANFYKATVTIAKSNEDLIVVKGTGNLNFEILAEIGLIQSIEGDKKR